MLHRIELRQDLRPLRHRPNRREQSAHQQIDHDDEKGDEHRLLLRIHQRRHEQPDPERRHQIDRRRAEHQWNAPTHRHVKDKPCHEQPKRKLDHRQHPERNELRRDERPLRQRRHDELIQCAELLLTHDVHRREQRANHGHELNENPWHHVVVIVELRIVPPAGPHFERRTRDDGRCERRSPLVGIRSDDLRCV